MPWQTLKRCLRSAVRYKRDLHVSSLARRHERLNNVITKVRRQHLTYLELPAIWDLVEAVLEIENTQLEGAMIETGCAAGGSAIAMTSAKRKDRAFFVYDVFGMIPPPSERDGQEVHQRYETISSGKAEGIRGTTYYGYEKNLDEKVVQSFADFGLPVNENNVHLVKGLYEQSLQVQSPVSLAHIDCDWYDSVTVCLERIVPHLVPGGRLIIDDYDAWSGCRKAVDDFFAQKTKKEYLFVKKTKLHIIKQ